MYRVKNQAQIIVVRHESSIQPIEHRFYLLYRSELSINISVPQCKAIDRNRAKKHLLRSVILLMLKIYPKRVSFVTRHLKLPFKANCFDTQENQPTLLYILCSWKDEKCVKCCLCCLIYTTPLPIVSSMCVISMSLWVVFCLNCRYIMYTVSLQ
jgi:hypothetical protein